MAKKIILKGHKGIGGKAEGEALVCKEPINLMADAGNCWTDPSDATFTSKPGTPSVVGKSFKDKVLVFPTGKGGIFSSNILMDMKAAGTTPKAIVNDRAHPVWAALCIELGFPLVDRLDKNPVEVIETGDWVKVDGVKGIVEVMKK
jgi:uncharacterized protein